jgi:electron transfer flavoprotein alpha subunit
MGSGAPDVVLVVAEGTQGVVTPLSLELVGLAHAVVASSGGRVAAVLTGDPAAAGALARRGVTHVYVCEADEHDYEPEIAVAAVEQIARELQPLAILAGHTPVGAELVPRLAFRLESAAATGCIDVRAEAGRLLFTRACFGGNVRETLSIAVRPAIATVKAGVGTPPAETAEMAEIVRVPPPAARRARVIARERERGEAQRLEDAKVIVAGGRGLEGPEGFKVLEALAGVLGGAVGSSRVPCDLGWCPHSWQIGLTGKTVTPELYFAVGISGAGHHMAGCGNAKTIVAINTDPDAAIFRDARFGIVGDYRKIVPALVEAVAQLKAD